ncbi:hypothetical protein Hanom_Chr05g00397611 [Helianthus anomalus]
MVFDYIENMLKRIIKRNFPATLLTKSTFHPSYNDFGAFRMICTNSMPAVVVFGRRKIKVASFDLTTWRLRTQVRRSRSLYHGIRCRKQSNRCCSRLVITARSAHMSSKL